jgi:sortase (surface protein transpeptidase)
MPILDLIRARVLPALLTAAGVTLVVAGLLSYTDPTEAGPLPSATPSLPTPAATAAAVPTPSPDGSPSPSVPAGRLATRVQIPALRVDLPIIKQPDPAYPSCNVAMYHEAFGPPGDPRGTYIYAHARTGMFLPLLDASKKNNGAAMKGMIVDVYTSDDMLFLYEVTEVRRHVPASFNIALLQNEGTTLLWLQTSEGPNHTYPKLLLKTVLLSSGPADHAAAHPKPKPVDCA